MQDSQIIRTEYSELMKKSYIDYAMSVIIARALPDVQYSDVRFMICTSLVSVMINHIENVPVSLGIRWENITHTVTVPSMMH